MLSVVLVYHNTQKNLQEYIDNINEEISMEKELIIIDKNTKNFNELCLDKEFWKLAKYEKVLVSNLKYKVKSTDIESWFQSNFDGIKRKKVIKDCNIDGRLSIRNKFLMLNILDTNTIDKNLFEDIFFFNKLNEKKILINFFIEDLQNFHNYKQYLQNINKFFDIIITYNYGDTDLIKYKTMKVQNYKQEIINYFNNNDYSKLILISYNKILVTHKNIILTENIIDKMYESFENINCDILSPVIYKDSELIYFGGLDLKNKYYFNEQHFKFCNLTKKNSLYYSQETQIFFEDFYICDIKNFDNIIINHKYENLKFYLDPDIQVEVKNNNYKNKNILKHFDISLFQEYFFLNKKFIHSFKFQNFTNLSLNQNKNILIIEDEILVPELNCGSKYIYEFIKTLLKLNYKVYFFTNNFCYSDEWPIQKLQVDKLRKLGVFVNLPNDNHKLNSIKLLLKTNYNMFDYIFVSRYHLMLKYYDIIRKYNPKSKLIFQTHDIHFLRKERELTLKQNELDLSFKFNELNLLKKCDLSIIVSDYEKNLLIDYYHIDKEKLFYYPIMFESEKVIIYESKKSKDIYFVGSNHKPNIDSINYFIETYFTYILKYDSTMILHIIGQCGKSITNHPNIKIHGVLSEIDMKNVITSCRVCITPLLYGAGVKGKVLDAFNLGIPVISSKIGAEGIKNIKNNENIFILDDDIYYSKKFFEIYNNYELLNLVSKNCKVLFEKEYSQNNSEKYVNSLIQKIDETPRYENIKIGKICILYVCYKHKDFHKELLKYYQELNDKYHYDIYVVNNNSSQIIESEDNIFVVEGNNEVYDFSGLDSGIKYLEKYNLCEKYETFIITNETFNKNGPFISLNNLNHDVFEETIKQNKVLGLVDSFNETFNLDYFSFNSWVRSNFVVMPYHIFMKIKDEILYFIPKNFSNIVCDTKLLNLIDTHLSHERYNLTSKTKKIKICCIFNEYHLTHVLRKNGILITDIRNF